MAGLALPIHSNGKRCRLVHFCKPQQTRRGGSQQNTYANGRDLGLERRLGLRLDLRHTEHERALVGKKQRVALNVPDCLREAVTLLSKLRRRRGRRRVRRGRAKSRTRK